MAPSSPIGTSSASGMIPVVPGAFHLQAFLTIDQQRWLVERCEQLGRDVGYYAPAVRGGRQMSLDMLCLGMHWNARTYTYETARSDYDVAPVPPLPRDLIELAKLAAKCVGMGIDPQVCLINRYGPHSRLSLHQDKDERAEVLEAGVPIVSLSVGDTATFMLGGARRRDPVARLLLRSGDAFVMGGPARLRFHGVAGLVPNSGPAELGIGGRYSLTFRQYA